MWWFYETGAWRKTEPSRAFTFAFLWKITTGIPPEMLSGIASAIFPMTFSGVSQDFFFWKIHFKTNPRVLGNTFRNSPWNPIRDYIAIFYKYCYISSCKYSFIMKVSCVSLFHISRSFSLGFLRKIFYNVLHRFFSGITSNVSSKDTVPKDFCTKFRRILEKLL